MLANLTEPANGKQWYKLLSEAEFALNNTIHKSTGEILSKLLFGVIQRGKVIDAIGEFLEQTRSEGETRDLDELRSKAKDKIEKLQKYYKEHFDKKRKEAYKYKVGDYVVIKNYDSTPGVPKKIIPRWKGPYEIDRVLRNDRYVLKDVENFQVTQMSHPVTHQLIN